MAGDNCTLLCEICCAAFSKKSNLNRHTRNVHLADPKFLCEHCSKNYITKSSLLRHIANTHSKITNKQPVKWQCPICIFESEKETMVEHYQAVHNIDTVSSYMVFDSFDDFQSWKQNMQNKTCSKYIRYRIKKYSDKLKYYYRCHRDGLYKGKGNNIRRMKKIGSNKINGHCPAKIDVTISETTGSVSIKHIKSHVGHEMESFRLSLTKTDKNFLFKKSAKQKDNKECCREPAIIEKIGKCETPHDKATIETYTCTKESSRQLLVEYDDNKAGIIKIGEIKNSLMEKFQLILQRINSIEQCEKVEKQLSNIHSILDNYENCDKKQISKINLTK